MTDEVGFWGADELARESLIPAFKALEKDGGVRCVAVADTDLDHARSAAGERHIPHAYGSLEDMVAEHNLTALVVATPHRTHADAACYAAERGIHVFGGNPMDETLAAARMMRDTATSANVVLAVGHAYRVQAAWAIDFVRSRKLGRVLEVEATFTGHGIPPGRHWWAAPRKRGAGLALTSELLSVVLPAVRSKPAMVRASASASTGRARYGPDFTVEDTFVLDLVFANGAAAHMVSAWEADATNHEINIRCERGTMSIKLMSTELMAAGTNPSDFKPIVTWSNGTRDPGPAPTPTEPCFELAARNFVRTIRGEEELLLTARAGFDVMAVLEAAYLSEADIAPGSWYPVLSV